MVSEDMKALTRWHGNGYTNIRLEFKLADLWIGAFWTIDRFEGDESEPSAATLHMWICLIPMLPIHITKVLY